MIITFAGFYLYMSSYLENQSAKTLEQLTVKIAEQIDYLYSEMNHISLQIIHTPQLMNTMRKASQSKDNENYFAEHTETARIAKGYLDSFNGPDLKVSRISMYNNHGDYVSLGLLPDNSSDIRARLQRKSSKADVLPGNENIRLTGPHADVWSGDGRRFVSFYREIRDVSKSYGIIEVQQNASKFEDILQFPNMGNKEVFVFDKDGLLVLENAKAHSGQLMTMSQMIGGKSAVLDHGFLARQDYIFSYRKASLSQWSIVLVEPKSEFLSPITAIGKLIAAVTITVTALNIIMIFLTSKQLTKPFRKLHSSIRNVSLNNLLIEVEDTSNEIILMNRTFNSMFERLKESMEQIDQARTREMRARLKSLDTQMDPHFLYNVLAVIGAAGEQAGVDKVMDLCGKLSGMLRYSSRNLDGDTLVRDEMNYAQHYLDLMKERYEDHFQYRLEMEEEALPFKVPRLIFQPLIENCFRHAFQKSCPPWVLHVSVKQTSEYEWLFEVKDWGDGFDPEILKRLQLRVESDLISGEAALETEKQLQGNAGGVGLLNTLIRTRLFYGGRAFYEIASNEPAGTIVRIGVTRND
ncbi:histidine kinase [Paenibacillus sp. sptzw28]|uniref:cache domain-containing sensor histidine kinase n=1 Tax=Paenibacillus sp. sptzw28 TaxID=715179 RepID=UPI001C6EFD2A|nr:sensor histidine kinase [Paenibacillus sp. sptzw28]QYR21495.1 histidine kinase [Paenibacillus sp. sptzw28]